MSLGDSISEALASALLPSPRVSDPLMRESSSSDLRDTSVLSKALEKGRTEVVQGDSESWKSEMTDLPASSSLSDASVVKSVALSTRRRKGLVSLIDSALSKTARSAAFFERSASSLPSNEGPDVICIVSEGPPSPPTSPSPDGDEEEHPSSSSFSSSSSSSSSSATEEGASSSSRLSTPPVWSRLPSENADRGAEKNAFFSEAPRRSSRVAALAREEEGLRVAESVWAFALPGESSGAPFSLEGEDDWKALLADRLSVAIPSGEEGGLVKPPHRVFRGSLLLRAANSPSSSSSSSDAAHRESEDGGGQEGRSSLEKGNSSRNSGRALGAAATSSVEALQCGGSILLRRSSLQTNQQQGTRSSSSPPSQAVSSGSQTSPRGVSSVCSGQSLRGSGVWDCCKSDLAGQSPPPVGTLCASLAEIRGLFDSLCVGARPVVGRDEEEKVSSSAATSVRKAPLQSSSGSSASLSSGQTKPCLRGRKCKTSSSTTNVFRSRRAFEPFLASEVYAADASWMDFVQLRRLLGSLLAGDRRLGELSGAGFHLTWIAYRFLDRIAAEPAVQRALAALATKNRQQSSSAFSSNSAGPPNAGDGNWGSGGTSAWQMPPSVLASFSDEWLDRAFLNGAWGRNSQVTRFLSLEGQAVEAGCPRNSLHKAKTGPWQKVFGYGDTDWPRFLCGTVDRRWALQQRNISVPVDVPEKAASSSELSSGSSTNRDEITLQFEEFAASAAQLFWPTPPELPKTLQEGQSLQVAVTLGGKNSVWWVRASLLETVKEDGLLRCSLDSSCADRSAEGPEEEAPRLSHPATSESSSMTAFATSDQTKSSLAHGTYFISSSGETETEMRVAQEEGRASTVAALPVSAQTLQDVPEKERVSQSQPRRTRTGKRVVSTSDLLKKPFFESEQTYRVSSLILPQVPVAAPPSSAVRLLPREARLDDFYSGSVLSVSGGALELRIPTGLTRVPDCYYKDVVVHKVLPPGVSAPSWLLRKNSRRKEAAMSVSLASEEGAVASVASESERDERVETADNAVSNQESGGRSVDEKVEASCGPSCTDTPTLHSGTPDSESRVEGGEEEEVPLEGIRRRPSPTQLVILLVLSSRTVRVVSVGRVLSRPCFKLPYDLHAHFEADSFHRLTRQLDDFLWAIPRAVSPSASALARRRREVGVPEGSSSISSSSTNASDWSAFWDVKTKLSPRDCLEGPPFCVIYVSANIRSLHKLPKYAPVAALLQPEVDVNALVRGSWSLQGSALPWRRPSLPPKALIGGEVEALGPLPCLVRHPSEGLPEPGVPFVVLHSWVADGWRPPPRKGLKTEEAPCSFSSFSFSSSSSSPLLAPQSTAPEDGCWRNAGSFQKGPLEQSAAVLVEGLGGELFDVAAQREEALASLQRNALADVLLEEETARGETLVWDFEAPYENSQFSTGPSATPSVVARDFIDLRLMVAESFGDRRKGEGKDAASREKERPPGLEDSEGRVFKKARVEGGSRRGGGGAGGLQPGSLDQSAKGNASSRPSLEETTPAPSQQQAVSRKNTGGPNASSVKRVGVTLLKRPSSTSPATLHRRSILSSSPNQLSTERLTKNKAGGGGGSDSVSDPMLVFSASPSSSEGEQEREEGKRITQDSSLETLKTEAASGPSPKVGSRLSRRAAGGAPDGIHSVERGTARGVKADKPKKPHVAKLAKQATAKRTEQFGDALPLLSDPVAR